jgi:tRNA 5-methylaminomethyl-2-thiouridine biosynthesis bifunctional protein
MQRALTAHNTADDFVTWVNQQEASSHAGLEVSTGGWWFPTAGWVNPSDYCKQLLQTSGATLITHTPVASLTQETDGWAARDTTGTIIAHGDMVVLANATDAPRLSAPFSEAVPIRPARGQTSVFASPPLPSPRVVICRNGYWTPAIQGQSTSGASFIVDDTDLAMRPEEHEENLAVVSGMLQKPLLRLEVTEPGILAGKVGLRPLVPDRLPLVGALPGITPQTDASLSRVARERVPGLFINSGYGARGILLATLCADLLACQISGEPLPLPKDLVRAIDPMRYAHKKTFTEETSNED